MGENIFIGGVMGCILSCGLLICSIFTWDKDIIIASIIGFIISFIITFIGSIMS